MKLLVKLLKIFYYLLLLTITALLIVLALLFSPWFAKNAVIPVTSYISGYKISADYLKLNPFNSLEAGNIQVELTENKKIRAEKFELSYSLSGLLHKEINIYSLIIEKADINYKYNSEKESQLKSKEAVKKNGQWKVNIKNASLANISIQADISSSDKKRSADLKRLNISIKDYSPGSVAKIKIGAGELNFAGTGKVTHFTSLEFNTTAKIAENNMPDELSLFSDVKNFKSTFADLNLPEFNFKIKTNLKHTGSSWLIENLAFSNLSPIREFNFSLTGSAAYTPSETENLKFDINLKDLNLSLSRFFAGKNAGLEIKDGILDGNFKGSLGKDNFLKLNSALNINSFRAERSSKNSLPIGKSDLKINSGMTFNPKTSVLEWKDSHIYLVTDKKEQNDFYTSGKLNIKKNDYNNNIDFKIKTLGNSFINEFVLGSNTLPPSSYSGNITLNINQNEISASSKLNFHELILGTSQQPLSGSVDTNVQYKDNNTLIKLDSRDIKFKELNFNKISGLISVKDKILAADFSELEINNSPGKLNLTYGFGGSLPDFSLNFFIPVIESESLHKTFQPESEKFVSGKLTNIDLTLEGKGLNPESINKNLSGKLNMEFDNIYLPTQLEDNIPFNIIFIPFNVAGKIGKIVPSQLIPDELNILSDKIKNSLDDNQKILIDKGKAVFIIKDAKINFSDFVISSPLMPGVYFSGDIYFNKSLKLSSGIEIIGLRLPIPISGTLNTPLPDITRFAYELVKALGHNITNLPANIFGRLDSLNPINIFSDEKEDK